MIHNFLTILIKELCNPTFNHNIVFSYPFQNGQGILTPKSVIHLIPWHTYIPTENVQRECHWKSRTHLLIYLLEKLIFIWNRLTLSHHSTSCYLHRRGCRHITRQSVPLTVSLILQHNGAAREWCACHKTSCRGLICSQLNQRKYFKNQSCNASEQEVCLLTLQVWVTLLGLSS